MYVCEYTGLCVYKCGKDILVNTYMVVIIILLLRSCHFCGCAGVNSSPAQRIGVKSSPHLAFFVAQQVFRTLGRHPEHCRVDRDKYIRIIWENIVPGKYLYAPCTLELCTCTGLCNCHVDE